MNDIANTYFDYLNYAKKIIFNIPRELTNKLEKSFNNNNINFEFNMRFFGVITKRQDKSFVCDVFAPNLLGKLTINEDTECIFILNLPSKFDHTKIIGNQSLLSWESLKYYFNQITQIRVKSKSNFYFTKSVSLNDFCGLNLPELQYEPSAEFNKFTSISWKVYIFPYEDIIDGYAILGLANINREDKLVSNENTALLGLDVLIYNTFKCYGILSLTREFISDFIFVINGGNITISIHGSNPNKINSSTGFDLVFFQKNFNICFIINKSKDNNEWVDFTIEIHLKFIDGIIIIIDFMKLSLTIVVLGSFSFIKNVKKDYNVGIIDPFGNFI